MNIYLIYGVGLVLFCGFLGNLLSLLKPNLFSKLLVWILASANLSSLFWFWKYGISISALILMFISVFVSLNLYRYGSERTDVIKMRNSIWMNSGWLFLVLAFIFAIEIRIIDRLNFGLLVDGAVGASFAGAIIALIGIIRTTANSKQYVTPKGLEGGKPTVTVAIAARNEDDVLDECIRAVLGSNYSKMEVLVLDDCSEDETGNLMKFYANHGVRFISGKEPPLGWLGQNWSYEQLYKQANGHYIVFIGADTLISPSTISKMIKLAESHAYKMVSLQPILLNHGFGSQLLHPLHLLRQSVYGGLMKRASVGSGIWMINKDTLRGGGGFLKMANTVYPEKTLANEQQKESAYYYTFASVDNGIVQRKSLKSLWNSALRGYYPRSNNSPAATCLTSLAVLAILIAPLIGILEAIFLGTITPVAILGLLAIGAWWLSNLLLILRVNPRTWFAAIINLPFMVIVDASLVIMSMLRYEFGTIEWKGRNICWVDKERSLKLNVWRRMQDSLRRT